MEVGDLSHELTQATASGGVALAIRLEVVDPRERLGGYAEP
jgi:hypothetical protein